MAKASGDVTQMLIAYSDGDRTVLDSLLPLVYDELRRIAASYLKGERPDHTLQPTALVHEAYMRLINQRQLAQSDPISRAGGADDAANSG